MWCAALAARASACRARRRAASTLCHRASVAQQSCRARTVGPRVQPTALTPSAPLRARHRHHRRAAPASTKNAASSTTAAASACSCVASTQLTRGPQNSSRCTSGAAQTTHGISRSTHTEPSKSSPRPRTRSRSCIASSSPRAAWRNSCWRGATARRMAAAGPRTGARPPIPLARPGGQVRASTRKRQRGRGRQRRHALCEPNC